MDSEGEAMRVLVAGGAGYIGSVLVNLLMKRGHRVRVVDLGLFGLDHLAAEAEVIPGDIRQMNESWLDDIDAVVNLAGLSNDPMANFSPRLNYEFNAAAAALLAQMSKAAGIRRFVFGSTCSVYGYLDSDEIDEDAPTKAQFPYAISKLMAERALACLADETFRPIILRKGTVMGWSPRMRYDLVTNTMVKTAITSRRIVVHNPSLWRPLVDVNDAARAYAMALEAPEAISGTFNICYDNFTVAQIAQEVVSALAEFGVHAETEIQHRADPRSYRVSSKHAADVLGFRAQIPVRQSMIHLLSQIAKGLNADLDNPRYVNVEWMKATMQDKVAA